MANLTLSIDDRLLQAARVRAVKEGTSVNEVCRRAIESYARVDTANPVARFDALIARIQAERPAGNAGRPPWMNRSDMYEQVLEERHPTLLGKKRPPQARPARRSVKP